MNRNGLTKSQIAAHSDTRGPHERTNEIGTGVEGLEAALAQAWRSGYYDGLADAANSRISGELVRRANPYSANGR